MTKRIDPRPERPFAFHRRTVLRGLGATMALPFLESLVGKRAWAQTAPEVLAPPKPRFFGFYVPCGINMTSWTPAVAGAGYALTPVLEPLSSVKNKVLVLSGLDATAANAETAGDHARGTSTFLTCAKPQFPNVRLGKSVDQIVADHYGFDVRLKSIELGMEGGSTAGTCDSGYSCAYQRNIAWSSPTTPMAKEMNPRLVFDRLFAGADANLTQAQIERRRAQDLSILDFVREDARALKPKLSRRDQRKLDEYQTGVRELEVRVENIDINESCALPDRPDGAPIDTEAYAKAMLDLVVTAFQCDVTRVGTFMVGNGGSTRTFPFLNVPQTHHELSHHQNDPKKLQALETINRWEVKMFAHFLARLDAIEEMGPNGEPRTILDDTFAVFGSELADGNSHGHTDMPLLVGGKAGGILSSGAHVRFQPGTSMANLYFTLLNGIGAPVSSFGDDGDRVLSEIRA